MRIQLSARTWRLSGGLGCLLLVALLAVPGMLQAAPVWCSPFETEAGQPVTPGQVAGPVVNAVGEPGQATGSSTTLPSMLYIPYGYVGVPAMPSAIDPAGQAGSFLISTPDHRGTGINTNLRSDAGDLANNLTFEGYFLMPTAELVTGTFVGRRLVTQKRGPTDDSSRVAVGIHPHTTVVTPAVDGLFEYEGFNYPGTVLEGQNGGVGFASSWTADATMTLPEDGLSLTSPASPLPSVGNRLSGQNGYATRALRRQINLGVDDVAYVSALMRKTATTSGTSRNLEIGLATSATQGLTAWPVRIGNSSTHRWFLTNSAAAAQAGSTDAGVSYFVLVKIVAQASGNDQFFMNVYGPDDVVPETEPETWLLTHSVNSSAVLTHLRIVTGSQLNRGEVDEIRLGSTYESVLDPDAPIGSPMVTSTSNTLSVYWAEEVPPVEPGNPSTFVNHLEPGSTPIAANTWYHFAMTYDGTNLRWYLDGQQQGEVVSPPLAGAGTAKLVLANNRMAGANDRGFFGLLDEMRIWDRALTPVEMLVGGGGPGAGLLWRSRFETQFGVPVTALQEANVMNCIDNTAGLSGTPAGMTVSTYEVYGQTGIPPIPPAIDPGGLAGSFVLSQPDLPTPAVNTKVPSGARDFGQALTAQGYFNSSRTFAIAVDAVGARLVSTMRSASDGQARLGIGLAANPGAPPPGAPNVLSVAYYPTDVNAVVVAHGTTPIQPGTWYHFALVWDGVDIRWYLNGQLEGQVLAPPLIAPGSGPMVVGNDRVTGGTRGFYGLLDKIVISDHVIEPEQFMTAGYDPCLGVWCNMPFADMNYDGYVDMVDFAEFQRCMNLGGGELPNGCGCADRNGDGVADALDVLEFAKCATGPGILWSPELAPDCDPQ